MNFVLFSCLLTSAVFGIPVPEDIAMLTIAIQVKCGALSFYTAFCICWATLVFSDTIQFVFGKFLGKRVLDFLIKKRLLNDKRREKIEIRLNRWGVFACFVARFIPGGRIPVFVLAGNIGINLLTFLIVDVISSAIIVLFWLLSGNYIYDLVKFSIHF